MPTRKLKFGKLPPKKNRNTLSLKKYLLKGKGVLPPPEERRGWEMAVKDDAWGLLGNDVLGDCVIAATLHWVQAATAVNGRPVTFTTEQAIEIYSAVTGYDPKQTNQFGDNPTDQGTAWTDMLEYWRVVGVFGHKISAWAKIDYKDLNAIRQGIDIFGGILIGTAVTGSMQQQFADGKPWNKPWKGGVEGLHGIPWLGHGKEGQTCITWGARQQMDLTANKMCDEAYCVITEDWLNSAFVTPLGINAAALAADIEALRV
jgi:hypothetical protein